MRRLASLGVVWFSCAEVALAVDPPHWTSAKDLIDCETSCHDPHTALGGTLTQSAGNVNLCQSCHNAAGLASTEAINNSDKAFPGNRGRSHHFDAPAQNAAFGAATPLQSAMLLRLMGGNVVCSTCHDQHSANSADGGTPHIDPAIQITALGSTGAVTSGGTYSGAGGTFYLIEIDAAGTLATARFRYSKDNGTSWMASGQTLGGGAPVTLDSGVTVTFSAGSYALSERWQLFGTWPFLRVAIDSGDNTTGAKLCRDCHGSWVMTHTALETWDNTYKSHPVGITLGANSRGYDRSAPLDGNGLAQGAGSADVDGNQSNDLDLDATARVECFTCHGIHWADGNTLSVDSP